MPQTSVTIKYVNPAKPGKKMGSIKTEDGTYYAVWPDKLAKLSAGSTVEIEYEQEGDIKFLRNILSPIGNGAYSQTGGSKGTPQQSVEMFVMGFLNRLYIGKGEFDEDIVANQIISLRRAWRDGWSINLSTEAPEGYAMPPDDEIPF